MSNPDWSKLPPWVIKRYLDDFVLNAALEDRAWYEIDTRRDQQRATDDGMPERRDPIYAEYRTNIFGERRLTMRLRFDGSPKSFYGSCGT